MHLLSIDDLSLDQILQLLEKAQYYIDKQEYLYCRSDALKHSTVALLFFEASTRTRVSFELAAKRMGAKVVNLFAEHSATKKGESLLDTIHTLQSMNCNMFVVRHFEDGVHKFLAENMLKPGGIINAGDGSNEHPSQALLDALTIRQNKKSFEDLTVTIIGDISHSRVANSNIKLLKKLGVKDIRLVAPEYFHVEQAAHPCSIHHDLKKGIKDADVIMALRIQKERIGTDELPDLKQYAENYCVTESALKHAKPNAIVMHPGPMNREVGIASAVADGPQSRISQQVGNGVAVRMAIYNLIGHYENHTP